MKALTLTASGLTSGQTLAGACNTACSQPATLLSHTEETTGQGDRCSRICSLRETVRRWTGETICLAVASLATAGFLLGFATGSVPMTVGCGLASLLAVAAADSGTDEPATTMKTMTTTTTAEGEKGGAL